MLTQEASAAYLEVQRRVAELQDAVIALGRVYESRQVGLEEWMDHMDDVMSELAEEMYED